MRTKTDGQGIMVSLLFSREFGFTFNLTEEELIKLLAKVNEKMKNTHYVNVKASIELHGRNEKNTKNEKNIEIPSFYRDFECSKERECYWDGNHAAIQIEDCTDFFFALFSSTAL